MRICVDRVFPNDAPSLYPPHDQDGTRLAALRSKIWPGQWRVLAVRFLEGTLELQNRIARVAAQWTRHTGIRFEFNNAEAAPIRISFTPGPSWSYIGTDALDPRIGSEEPTMNFGWLHPGTPQDELQRVVLHEFGHALGMIHEHQSPTAAIPWDLRALQRHFSGPPNHWTADEIDANIVRRYSHDQVNASTFDAASIMLYPIPAELTGGQFQVGWNRTLSAQDQRHICSIYPPISE